VRRSNRKQIKRTKLVLEEITANSLVCSSEWYKTGVRIIVVSSVAPW
jgi:hypothetical protein